MAEKAIAKTMFVWAGKDRRGQKVKGEISGNSEALIRAELRRQGISPTQVRKKPKPLLGQAGKQIKPGDIAVFSRQLATMMTAGVPLVQALEIVGRGHDNPRMQDLVLAIKADIEGGTSLADALGKHPVYFDELFVNLTRSGEQSGTLETLLDKVASYKEKTEAIKGKIKSAMFYPISVLVVAMVVTVILLLFVVPSFAELFAGFGADLPAMTQMVIEMSEFMQSYWFPVFAGIGGTVYGIQFIHKRSAKFRHLVDRLLLRLPVFGEIFHKSAIARFSRTLATMFAAGVPLVEALESVAGSTGNAVYSDAVLKMRDDAATGQQLQVSLKQTTLWPNMVIQMVAIGEESGNLETMLTKVADFYEAEVDNMVDAMTSLLEPFIIVILGTLVGGLVVAMYLPIFKLGQVV